jgi:hypothetical protein
MIYVVNGQLVHLPCEIKFKRWFRFLKNRRAAGSTKKASRRRLRKTLERAAANVDA